MRASFVALCALLSLSGCAYHLGDQGTLSSRYQTIRVPFVEGDSDGRFTQALVRALAADGSFRYCSQGGDLTLCARVKDCARENIGFRRDENPQGEDIRRLLPDEAQLIYAVEYSVLDNCSGACVLGPSRIVESVAYDFDPLFKDKELLTTSLGQLTNVGEAEIAARTPLYDRIACKIIDSVALSW